MKLSDCKTIDELKKFLKNEVLYQNVHGKLRKILPWEVHVDFNGEKFRAALAQGCFLDELFDKEDEAQASTQVWRVKLLRKNGQWVLEKTEVNFEPMSGLNLVFTNSAGEDGTLEYYGFLTDQRKISNLIGQLKQECISNLEKERMKLDQQIEAIRGLEL